jgi:hypothetical protein
LTIGGIGSKLSSSNTCGYLWNLNSSNGDTIWTKQYSPNPNFEAYIYDLKATRDGGFIFCGFGIDTTNKQRAWIVKVDCGGNDSIHYAPDNTCVPLAINDVNLNKIASKIAPNPFNGFAILEFQLPNNIKNAVLTIYDLQGRLMRTAILDIHANEIEVLAEGLADGVYIYTIETDGIQSFDKKRMVIIR